jgi:ClpA/ClpB-like protein
MLVYDDAAAAVLHAAADEARRLGRTEYDTAHVLLGLLTTADPVARTITEEHPQLTLDAARASVSSSSSALNGAEITAVQTVGDAATKPVPAPEFRRAARRFTAKWRPLVRAGQLRLNPKLGSGELWLIVLEPATASASVLASLQADPETIRPVVLAAMAPDHARLPAWPTEVPVGAFRRLLDRLGVADARRRGLEP